MEKNQLEKLDQEIIDLENTIIEMHQCCRTFEDYETLKEWQNELKSKQLQRESARKLQQSRTGVL